MFEKDTSGQDTKEACLMFIWGKRLRTQVRYQYLTFNFFRRSDSLENSGFLPVPLQLLLWSIPLFHRRSDTWRERRGFLRTYGRKGSFVCPLKRQMTCLPPPTPLLRQWSLLVGGSETIQALTNPCCHSELGGNKGLRAWKLKHDF